MRRNEFRWSAVSKGIAQTVPATVIALLACACNGSPTLTPSPEPSAAPPPSEAASPFPTPVRTQPAPATANATYLPRRSPTSTRVPPSWPAAVAMSLGEAEAVVLGWAIPDVDRRVERSAYVSDDALAEVLGRLIWVTSENGPHHVILSQTAQKLSDQERQLALRPLGHALIVVEASDAWISLFEHDGLDEWIGGKADEMASGGAREGERKRFVAFFDAATGASLGTLPRDYEQLTLLSAIPTLPADRLRPATRTPATPTQAVAGHVAPPTPLAGTPPQGVLATGEVPPSVASLAAKFPIMSGAWWRYRSTTLQDLFYWQRTEATVVVVQSIQVSPDVVRSTTRLDPRGSPGFLGSLGFFESQISHFYLLPAAMVGRVQRDRSLDDVRGYLAQPTQHPPTQDPLLRAPAEDIFMLYWQVGERPNYWWHLVDIRAVTTPAGTFQDCAIFERIFSARVTAAIWLCPGVGFVRAEIPVLGSMYSNWITAVELVDYHIPQQWQSP